MYKLAKPYLFACLFGGILILSSCNDKDEDNFIATEISGTWSYNSFDFSATINGVDFLEFLSDALGIPESQLDYLEEEFDEDYNEFEGWTLDLATSGEFTMSFPGETDEVGTWSLDEENKKLILTLVNESMELDIVTLNSTSLVAIITESTDFLDFDGDGTSDEFVISMTLGFTK